MESNENAFIIIVQHVGVSVKLFSQTHLFFIVFNVFVFLKLYRETNLITIHLNVQPVKEFVIVLSI